MRISNILGRGTIIADANGTHFRTQLGARQKGNNRNKPCECGSLKKYKNCCKEQDLVMNKEINKIRSKFLKKAMIPRKYKDYIKTELRKPK